jgi:hypothetical protein
VRPTRYREVVLTSWDRSISDCEVTWFSHSLYREVVLTSWDRASD